MTLQLIPFEFPYIWGKFELVSGTGPKSLEERRGGLDMALRPQVPHSLTETYRYRPVQAHSCPGLGKKEASSRRAWPVATILMDRSQKIHFCCKDSWHMEQVAGGCKNLWHSEIFKSPDWKNKREGNYMEGWPGKGNGQQGTMTENRKTSRIKSRIKKPWMTKYSH